jgi:hypothetical protein
MIETFLKLYKKYILLIIIILSSCENKSISNFDKNIDELIDWSLLEEPKYQSMSYTPISSNTLAELMELEEYTNLIQPKNGILIGYFNFSSNKNILTEENKDLLILISKAQKYENFNILIQSNDIKSNLRNVIDEIKNILVSNGINNNKISLASIDDINEDFVIKIIKLF